MCTRWGREPGPKCCNYPCPRRRATREIGEPRIDLAEESGMSDGREEREEEERRRELERRKDQEDRLDRDLTDRWEPERDDS